ncbi:hypothetical protein VPH35_060221 [Triticum aestivum]
MTILCWNCWGLGHPGTVRELVCLVHTYRPSVVFLSETRQCEESVKRIRGRLGLKHCITHDGVGKGAGIALFWDDSIEIKLLSYGPRYIDVHVRNDPHGPLWRGTFVYGEPKSHERHHMWNLLKRIKQRSTQPWMIIGDFNETMWQGEHFSATRRSERNMSNFSEALAWCDVHDLGYQGPDWTYDNKQAGIKKVRARLDRGVASMEWSELFPHAHVQHIVTSRSDHFPLLLSYEREVQNSANKRHFRYESMWERVQSLEPTVKETWDMEGPAKSLADVMQKLGSVQKSLTEWSKKNFGSITWNIKKKRQRLKKLLERPYRNETEMLVKKVSAELDELLIREEMMWRQRSRATWIREGDQNIKFFHSKATWRQKEKCNKKIEKQ